MAVLIKNLLPAIRARLLMVSWVDRGLDLEGGGWGGGAEEGEVIMQLKWLGNGRCPRFGSGGGGDDREENGFRRTSRVQR